MPNPYKPFPPGADLLASKALAELDALIPALLVCQADGIGRQSRDVLAALTRPIQARFIALAELLGQIARYAPSAGGMPPKWFANTLRATWLVDEAITMGQEAECQVNQNRWLAAEYLIKQILTRCQQTRALLVEIPGMRQ